LGNGRSIPLRGVRGLQNLKILHRVECIEEPLLVWIDIQPSCLQGKEKLVGRLDRGKAPCGGLALDGETAGGSGFDHQTRQAHEGRTLPHDRPGAVPRCIDEKNHEPGLAGCRGGEASAAHAHRTLSWIEQDGVVARIVDQRTKPGIVVKAHSLDDLAVGQVQAREPSCRAFLMAELLGVHEEDDPRPRLHGRLGRAEAAGHGTPAFVAGLSRQWTRFALSLISCLLHADCLHMAE
jgi:hypothetical protein